MINIGSAAPAEPSFEAALLRLSLDRPELGIAHTDDPELAALAEVVDGTRLNDWLSQTATLSAGIDPRTAAAYLISIFTWKLGDILGATYLLGARVPLLTADDLMVSQAVSGTGAARDVNFRFNFRQCEHGHPFDRAALHRTTINIHTPLVARLHLLTGLSTRALWRLVTDGLSAGLLTHGKRTGCADLARAEATATLSDKTSPLHNPQWRFVEITAEGVEPEWFRLRGGCCRLYRTAGGQYCSTCVVLPADRQIARLRSILEGRAR